MPFHSQFSYKSIFLNHSYYGRFVLLIFPHKALSFDPYYAIPISEESLITYVPVPSSKLESSRTCKAASFAKWVRKQKRKEQRALGLLK